MVVDGEVKIKQEVPCRRTAEVKDGREAWIEGPDRWVASHEADTWDIDEREDVWS